MNGVFLVLKVGVIICGFCICSCGVDFKVYVCSLCEVELVKYMLEKLLLDIFKFLFCLMSGLIVKVDVEVGDEV